MLHTTLFPSRQCRIVLLHLDHSGNITKHQLATSACLFKAKFDLSDDLTNGPHDLIGPPRPASNLRPVKFAVRKDLPVYIKSCLLLLRCEKASLPLRRGWEVWGRRHRSLTRTGGQSTTGSSSRAGKILSRIFWRPSILMSLTSQPWVQMRCLSSTGICHSRHPAFISQWKYSPPYFLNISGSSWIVSGRAMLSTIRSGRRETGPLFFSQPEWSYRGSWTEDDDGLKSIILQIMTSRALRLLATNKWIRPLNATLALPSTSGLVRLEPYSFLPARRTLVTSTWLQNSLSDEDEVILLVGTTKNESRMRYKQTQFRTKVCRCHFQV